MRRLRAITLTTTAGLGAMLAACAPAGAQATFQRVFTLGTGPSPSEAIARTPDGRLHVMYQTTNGSSPQPTGLGTRYITPSGKLSAPVQALSGWTMAVPGLAAMPDGSLLAAFGAVSPAANNLSSMWTISSSDGGLSWSAPAQAYSNVVQAYGANLNAQTLGGTPILTLNVAGGIATQQGAEPNAPSLAVTDSSDDFAGEPVTAVDSTGSVVAGWSSNAGSGGDYMREVAPTLGPVQKVPGIKHDELQVAARTTGAGVYAPYSPNGASVRLLRYGGGSVAVGKLKGVLANALGVATGIGGRVWVMWGGDSGGIAVTRSNMAVTRFEPIQHLDPRPFTLDRLYGDGRLGGLDLLVDEAPKSAPTASGGFYARVLAELSVLATIASKTAKTGKILSYSVKVKVSDAGDPVASAVVHLDGKTAKTNSKGAAVLKLPGSAAATQKLRVSRPSYQLVSRSLEL